MKKWIILGLIATRLVVADPEIKAVIFDCGGVMVSRPGDLHLDFIARTLGMDWVMVKQTFPPARKMMARGEIEEEEFWNEFAKAHGRTLPEDWHDQYVQAHVQRMKVREEMVSLVRGLNAQGYRVAMISNTVPSKAAAYRKVGLFAHFDPLVLSYEVKMMKPDGCIYNHTLEMIDLSAAECLFIDDGEKHVKGAQAVGMHAVRYRSQRDLERCLAEYGIEWEVVEHEESHPSPRFATQVFRVVSFPFRIVKKVCDVVLDF